LTVRQASFGYQTNVGTAGEKQELTVVHLFDLRMAKFGKKKRFGYVHIVMII
jgi:hypothetical protein